MSSQLLLEALDLHLQLGNLQGGLLVGSICSIELLLQELLRLHLVVLPIPDNGHSLRHEFLELLLFLLQFSTQCKKVEPSSPESAPPVWHS